MSVFNPPHFLRHIGMPTLREFTEAHVLGPYLTLDWTQDEATLPAMVSQAVEALATELPTREMPPEARKATADALGYWYDDLRRCHLMANSLAVEEFLLTCADDEEVLAAFADRDDREKAMWMFTVPAPARAAAKRARGLSRSGRCLLRAGTSPGRRCHRVRRGVRRHRAGLVR